MTSNVTSGEGAESDDDSSPVSSFMKNTMVTNTMVTSTMVSGEASETDDEDEDDETQKGDPYGAPMQAEEPLDSEGHVALTTELEETKEAGDNSSDKKKVEKAKRHKLEYKYDTPFHRKLREKNIQLRSGMVEGVCQMYRGAALKLDSSYYHITKAQTSVQDIAYNTKIILEDLHSLGHVIHDTVDMNYLSSLKTTH